MVYIAISRRIYACQADSEKKSRLAGIRYVAARHVRNSGDRRAPISRAQQNRWSFHIRGSYVGADLSKRITAEIAFFVVAATCTYYAWEKRKYFLSLDELPRRIEMEGMAWAYSIGLLAALWLAALAMHFLALAA